VCFGTLIYCHVRTELILTAIQLQLDRTGKSLDLHNFVYIFLSYHCFMRKYLFHFSVTIFIFKVVQQLCLKTEHVLIYYILAITL